ncbi:MAG: nucleotide pyrophosphatase/phosphodiesterase family protein [Planctomycetota bacterium]
MPGNTARKTLVLNVVGLTPKLLKHAPNLRRLADETGVRPLMPPVPAVTCTSQMAMLTGTAASEHGIVGNGWYDRSYAEVKFWKQSDGLVQRPRVWDRLAGVTCANLFWWYAMYCGADVTVTPRPMYPADGRKLPDIWTNPVELRDLLQRRLGQFPLFKFWGPMANIESTRWIADAAIEVERRFGCDLTLVYLPHLDYALQKVGPDHASIPAEVERVDAEVGKLLGVFDDAAVRVVSEYGIEPVDTPVHLNRVLRRNGWLSIRYELGRELLDAGASRAFAVSDHQVAHVYAEEAVIPDVAEVLAATEGIADVIFGSARRELGLDHERAGDIIVLAERGAWFTYYYWFDDAKAPDFARTVDIHRKPGYDPAELFLDPDIRFPKLRIARKLAARKAGLRAMLDVTPIDASCVRGSHGLVPSSPDEGPLLIGAGNGDVAPMTDVADVIRDAVLG